MNTYERSVQFAPLRQAVAWAVIATSAGAIACKPSGGPALCSQEGLARLKTAGASEDVITKACPGPTPAERTPESGKREEPAPPKAWKMQPTALSVIKADPPSYLERPALIFVAVKPSDYFNYGYSEARGTHFAFELREVRAEGRVGVEGLYGYAPRSWARPFFEKVTQALQAEGGKYEYTLATLVVAYSKRRQDASTADHIEILAADVGQRFDMDLTSRRNAEPRSKTDGNNEPSPGSVSELPVKVGDDLAAFGRDRPQCRSDEDPGVKVLVCQTASRLGGLEFTSLAVESRGGARIDRVRLQGKRPRSCRETLDSFASTLGTAWTLEPFQETSGNGQVLNALVQGDLQLRVACSDYIGLSLSVEDAWLSLPPGERLAPPEMPIPAPELPLAKAATLARGVGLWPRGIGEVVWNTINNYGSAARTLKVPEARRGELIERYAWPEVQAALANAKGAAAGLSPRSAKAFEDYAGLVASQGWYAQECRKAWSVQQTR
jgi:hypothetical protein